MNYNLKFKTPNDDPPLPARLKKVSNLIIFYPIFLSENFFRTQNF